MLRQQIWCRPYQFWHRLSHKLRPQMLLFLHFPGPRFAPLRPRKPERCSESLGGILPRFRRCFNGLQHLLIQQFPDRLAGRFLQELKFVKFVKVYKLYNAKVFTKTITKTCYIMLWLLWAGLWLFWAQIIMGWHVVDWFVMEFENVIHSGWALWKARVFSKYVLDSWLTFTDILFLLAEWKKNL